ncbi:HPr kinase/phosphorylase [Sphingomonas sp.]|uniref:HPr kinase/phosphorylase n=1 Tax=Sphingomonas sp. TaxID=28214 RepID=UPI0035C7CC8F
MTLVHATTVAINDHGVMLIGASGAGKSDLALRLIDRGATLVSDDYTGVARHGETLVATAPATIAGQIEIRGVGIVAVPFTSTIVVKMVVELGDEVARMPEARWCTVAEQQVRAFVIDPRPASAAIKVEYALAQLLSERAT